MQTRKPASVLPEPVGAAIRGLFPAAISGQPATWGGGGPSGKRPSNHARTAGWKPAISLIGPMILSCRRTDVRTRGPVASAVPASVLFRLEREPAAEDEEVVLPIYDVHAVRVGEADPGLRHGGNGLSVLGEGEVVPQ